MTQRIRNSLFGFIVVCFSCRLQAQVFENKAAIGPTDKAGFYSITVTPDFSSYVQPDFSDLRLKDEKNNPVPYLLSSHLEVLKPDFFVPLKIINNTLTDSGETMLIIENNPVEKLEGFSLRIKNAAVSRTMNISGSDNLGDWFSIVENLSLERRYIQDHDSYLENISFPLSSYRYFRIMIYNGKNDPLNIIAAGKRLHAEKKTTEGIVDNPSITFIQKDSDDHISYLRVLNPRAFHISHVGLRIKSPRFFKRHVDILTKQQTLGNFVISSDTIFNFTLPVFNDSGFLIRIYNEDNGPLNISGISTGQDVEKIITFLEPDTHYHLELTGENIPSPHYDLQNFKDSIPAEIPELQISKIEPIGDHSVVEEKDFFRQRMLWPVIIFVLCMLVLFTIRLTRDIQKRP
jgi:hypothetical protein